MAAACAAADPRQHSDAGAPDNPHGYPRAPWRPVEDRWPGGQTIVDGYRWFEDAQDPEVLAWVAQQNAYTDGFFAREMPGRVPQRIAYLREHAGTTSYSNVTPVADGYVATATTGGEHTIVHLDEGFANPRQLFCAQDSDEPCKVVSAAPCPGDPNLLACCVLFDRAPRLSILMRDLATGATLARLDGMFFWAWDARGTYLYYSDAIEHPESGTNSNAIHRWCRVSGEVELVCEIPQNAVFCDVQPDALDGLFVLVHPDYGTQVVYHLDAGQLGGGAGTGAGGNLAGAPGGVGAGAPAEPTRTMRLVSGDAVAAFAYVGTVGGRHLLLTTWGAPTGRIVSVDASAPGLDGAREVVGPRSGCSAPAGPDAAPDGDAALGAPILCGALVMGDTIVCAYQSEAVSTLRVFTTDGVPLGDVPLPDSPGCLNAGEQLASPLAATNRLCLGFESFRMPASVIGYDPATRTTRTLYTEGADAEDATRQQAPVDADASGIPAANRDVVVERIEVPARDGETLTAYLVHRADVEPTGAVPTLLYGYGGYNVVLSPSYANPFVGLNVVDWAHRGGLYIHCILRGGGERGAAWHEAGMLARKPTVFCDFIDIIAHVQKLGWTCPEKTAICGGSNGGLLVTATLTQAPELLRCAIASVPHTDMLRFAYDDRGPMYITEYGDPRDPALFPIMRGYSPYHNIHAGQVYPALYVQTGEVDNNVPPYHGKKFAARMQREAAPDNPVVLRVLAHGAHDRGEGDAYYQTVSEMQCFLEHYLGM